MLHRLAWISKAICSCMYVCMMKMLYQNQQHVNGELVSVLEFTVKWRIFGLRKLIEN